MNLCKPCHDAGCVKWSRDPRFHSPAPRGFCERCGKGQANGRPAYRYECHQYDFRREEAPR